MSSTITVAQVQQYKSNILMLFQQEGSKLRSLVRTESINAKYHYFERLAPTTAIRGVSRHAPTPQVDSQHSRRRVGIEDFAWADLIDDEDKLRMLIDPQSAYAQNAAHALGRAVDMIIIEAFTASAFEGETGATVTPFPTSTNQIVDGGTGMTIAKLRQLARFMDANNVPESGRHVLYSPIAKEQLLKTTEVTSADFNTVRALVQGQIDTFLGFKFHMIADAHDGNMLPKTGNVRTCFGWHERCMGLALAKDISVRVDQRPDLRYATQVYACATFGAVRIEDEGVFMVDIDESV